MDGRRAALHNLKLTPTEIGGLIEIRRRLLRGLPAHPGWADAESELADLFREWFDPAHLEFRRLDTKTSRPILESLIRYEAVHQVRSWRELMRRLQADRRCYGFFHPALPNEPLIFTELAFTRGICAKVQPLLEVDSPVIHPAVCDTAMFYSISSCHEGLRGVALGNALIRRVVERVRHENPWIRTFATISPVPGFRDWLRRAFKGGTVPPAIAEGIADPTRLYHAGPDMERVLVPLCASYLLDAKRGAEPADPVARFHLGNGARLERLNWLGDTSSSGLQRSAGFTANYLYELSEIDANSHRYQSSSSVAAAPHLRVLANVH